MIVNEENYHKFLEDFIDGTLDPAMEAAFMQFLDLHPEILDEANPLTFDPTHNLENDFKLSLKRDIPVNDTNINEWLIADLEGDLSENETKELEQYIGGHASIKNDQKLFSLTKLDRNETFVFKNKESLKKRPLFVLYPLMRVAAAVVLLMAMWFVFKPGTQPVENPVANSQDTTPGVDSGSHSETESTPSQQLLAKESSDTEKPAKSVLVKKQTQENTPQEKRPEENSPEYRKEQPGMETDKNPEIKFSIPGEPEPLLALVIEMPEEKSPEINNTNNNRNLTPVEWAYKKLRSKVAAEEKNVPKPEISEDLAVLFLDKIRPVIDIREGSWTFAGITVQRKVQSANQ